MTVRDLEIEIRVRNNQLKERRLELGFNQREMAEALGTSTASYCAFETMRRSPITCKGDWTDSAKQLGLFHGVEPAELFPESVLSIENTSAVAKVDASDVMQLMGGDSETPHQISERCDTADHVIELLDTPGLNDRDRQVLRLRFGIDGGEPMGLRQIGEIIGKSVERTRQIEARALRMMRDPAVSHELHEPGWWDAPRKLSKGREMAFHCYPNTYASPPSARRECEFPECDGVTTSLRCGSHQQLAVEDWSKYLRSLRAAHQRAEPEEPRMSSVRGSRYAGSVGLVRAK